jgi:ribosomal protein S18 acetylase RimI-like enzyme
MIRHSWCEGFRCITARHNGIVVGFTYGMHGEQNAQVMARGEMTTISTQDLINEKVNAGELQAIWLEAFDLAELQVMKEHRGRGLGKGLVLALCDRLAPGTRVVLMVTDTAHVARHLYDRLGFQPLFRTLPPLYPPTWQTVMATTLPLRQPTDETSLST